MSTCRCCATRARQHPGTAAEILDDEVREILSHKKVDVATWIEIITTAHRVGVPSTATIMYGHVETTAHVARRISSWCAACSSETGGFTEFVPLRFIHQNTALFQRGLVQLTESGAADFRMYAACRLFFRGTIDNLQTSGEARPRTRGALPRGRRERLRRYADGGEHLARGRRRRRRVPPQTRSRQLVRSMGRVPRQRTTLYKELHRGAERRDRKLPRGARRRRRRVSSRRPGKVTALAGRCRAARLCADWRRWSRAAS